MKKHLFMATVAVAMLSSCASEVIPERPVDEVKSPIAFTGEPGAMTRAAEGAAAATLLGNEFVVYGDKTGGEEQRSGLFVPGYVVKYEGAEGHKVWDYTSTEGQTIRFWDFDATYYTFVAYSNKNRSADNQSAENPKIVGPTVFPASFTIPVVTAEQLGNIHFAKKKTISTTSFGSDVNFMFSNAAAKIRVAFYNTIPGYHVNILGFYSKNATTATNDFYFYHSDAVTFVNKASYTVTPGDDAITYTMKDDGKETTSDIKLGASIGNANQVGGPNISDATFDNNGKYTFVHPQPSNASPLVVKVRYQMWTDGDTHPVEEHNVIIPAEYAQWKPNHAYTYFFKITDSNLHPIVFSAEVEDFITEETITTVDPSNEIDITTYIAGSDVQGNDQYLVGNAISVAVTCPDGMTIEKFYGSKAVADFEDETVVNESNCEKLITAWSPLDTTLQLDHQGYYVFRVKWTKTSDNTTGYAYKVIKVTTPSTAGE